MMLWSLLAIALLVFVVAATVRLLAPRKDQFTSAVPDELERAKGVLAERYARGEIDDDEYRRRREAIESLRRR
jgi:putative membrane protein